MYNKRVWLNRDDSSSTGSVVAYDGEYSYDDKKIRHTFLKISDCYVSAKLHKTDDDSIEDFINKMKLLKDEISEFINYLEKNI